MKSNRVNIKMRSEESPHFYTTQKNPKNTTSKLRLRLYDPTLRRHAWYKEDKLK